MQLFMQKTIGFTHRNTQENFFLRTFFFIFIFRVNAGPWLHEIILVLNKKLFISTCAKFARSKCSTISVIILGTFCGNFTRNQHFVEILKLIFLKKSGKIRGFWPKVYRYWLTSTRSRVERLLTKTTCAT